METEKQESKAVRWAKTVVLNIILMFGLWACMYGMGVLVIATYKAGGMDYLAIFFASIVLGIFAHAYGRKVGKKIKQKYF